MHYLNAYYTGYLLHKFMPAPKTVEEPARDNTEEAPADD